MAESAPAEEPAVVDEGGLELEEVDCGFDRQLRVCDVATCVFRMHNRSAARDLVIAAVPFGPDTPLALDGSGNFSDEVHGFGSYTFVFTPLFVAPGTSADITLFASPQEAGPLEGVWRVESSFEPHMVEHPIRVFAVE